MGSLLDLPPTATVVGQPQVTYTYDNANRLMTIAQSTSTVTIAYDDADRRTSVTYPNTNKVEYAYNAASELATVTYKQGTTTYTWNARNQLTSISKTGFTASFTYDSFGRRAGRTVNGTVTNYVYDGLNPVQEKNGAMVTANLLIGLGIDEFFTRTDGVGVRALLPDALGSTVALGDSIGTLQTQYTYEPFGFTTQTGAASTSSYKFTGREDDGTGLLSYRARYYSPRMGRSLPPPMRHGYQSVQDLAIRISIYGFVASIEETLCIRILPT